MPQITTEFQKTIENKLKAAFFGESKGDYLKGDCFMQKNNFDEIIAVSKYDLEKMQAQGWEYFQLACFQINEPKPIQVVEKAQEKAQAVGRNNYNYGSLHEIDEYPDAYEAFCCGF